MRAECQIDDCGIVAIGRCSTCGRAFCMTHQARTRTTDYVDVCTDCLARRDAAARDERRKDDPKLFPDEARRRLRAANVPLVDVFVAENRATERSNGQIRAAQWVKNKEKYRIGRGWLLGPASWQWNGFGPYDSEATYSEMFLAVLLEEGDYRRGLIPVVKDSSNRHVRAWGDFSGSYRGLNAELERLTGVPFDGYR